jgi:hypothetical protein
MLNSSKPNKQKLHFLTAIFIPFHGSTQLGISFDVGLQKETCIFSVAVH